MHTLHQGGIKYFTSWEPGFQIRYFLRNSVKSSNAKLTFLVRDGFNHVGALGPGSCGGPVFVSQGEENKLGLIRAELSHIWPKFDFDEFLTDLDRTWHIIS